MTHKLSKSASIIKIHPRVLCVGVKNSKPRFLTAWLTGGSYGRVRYRGRKPLWCWTYWKQFEVNRITEFRENGRPRIAKKSDKKNSRDFLNFWKNFFFGFSVSRAKNRPIDPVSYNFSTISSLRSTRHLSIHGQISNLKSDQLPSQVRPLVKPMQLEKELFTQNWPDIWNMGTSTAWWYAAKGIDRHSPIKIQTSCSTSVVTLIYQTFSVYRINLARAFPV